MSQPVDDDSDRVQMNMAREDWVKFQAWEQQRNVLQATSSAPKAIEKHLRFFLPTENIFFLVENMLYSVPRAPFERQSSAFTGKSLTEDDPLILVDVKVADFDHFLSILYPSDRGMSATTVDEWAAILHLAIKWGFEFIRTLSTKHIARIATDIDKIVLGRQYGVNPWLLDAFVAVCIREQSLTTEEGRRMKVEDIIGINAIRQQFGFGAQLKVTHSVLVVEISTRFGLAAPGATIGSPLPLASDKSESTSSAHVNGGLAAPTRDGTILAVPIQVPSMFADELGSEASAKAAAELRRAQMAKERELTDCALYEYYSSAVYSKRFSKFDNGLVLEAVRNMRRENYKQDLVDFIGGYIAEESLSTVP
ncbi:hypothetical protein FIBSPDRAFT_1035806 [Athelia psychrophila]|uniref:BTB domain-containing protein n=1 Tax=Athelia psychrophila TaxID=1759441 RepID=A0A166WJI8_9AGAM|nr:hypothetical protein FIBSPDRAFT_1035806 [Fibularhizoctonia sp. CBS 109695]